MTNRYSNLTRAIPLAKMAANTVAREFLGHWIMPYGILNLVLTENGPQFTVKFLAGLYGFLGFKNLTTKFYYPQANGQT